MTTSDSLSGGKQINLAIIRLAAESEYTDLIDLLIFGKHDLFRTEGKEMLRILDELAGTMPQYAERVEQIKAEFVPRMERILTDAQADG